MFAIFFRLALVVALAVPVCAHADPLRHPKRVVGGRTADLSPLFTWWKNHGSERPMTAWVHLTGTIVGTNAYGWVVKAQLEEMAPKPGSKKANKDRVILKTPPAQDYAAFVSLQAQLKTLNAEEAKIAKVESQAAKRSNHTNPGRTRRSRIAAAQAREAQRVEEQAKGEQKAIKNRIEAVQKQLAIFPSQDHYAIDCFAMDTGQEQNGLTIYDHGMPLN